MQGTVTCQGMARGLGLAKGVLYSTGLSKGQSSVQGEWII